MLGGEGKQAGFDLLRLVLCGDGDDDRVTLIGVQTGPAGRCAACCAFGGNAAASVWLPRASRAVGVHVGKRAGHMTETPENPITGGELLERIRSVLTALRGHQNPSAEIHEVIAELSQVERQLMDGLPRVAVTIPVTCDRSRLSRQSRQCRHAP